MPTLDNSIRSFTQNGANLFMLYTFFIWVDSELGRAIYPFKDAFRFEEKANVSFTFSEALSDTTELQEAKT